MGERRKRIEHKKFVWKKYWLKVLGVLVFCLLIFLGSLLVRSEWGSFNYTVGIIGKDKIAILSVDPVAKQAVVMEIPGNMMLPVVGMKGELKASSVWKFGAGEGEMFGLTRRTLENFLGIKIDRLARVESWDGEAKGLSSLWWRPMTTDIKTIDRVRLALFLRSLRDDQWSLNSVPLRLGVTEELPDGSRVVVMDTERLAGIMDDFVNEMVLSSGLRVTIEDATGEKGTAVVAERILRTAGGVVTQIKRSESKDGWCFVGVTQKDENEAVVRWLVEKLGCEKKLDESFDFEARLTLGKAWGEAYQR